MPRELVPEELRRVCNPDSLGFVTTESLPSLEGITGQDRAVTALEFGLGIHHKGFNVYVAGAPGTGKMTAVDSYLRELGKRQHRPPDYCYINNFSDSYRPLVLELPPARGRELKRGMADLVQRVREEFPRALESDDYTARREAIARNVQREREELLSQLNQRAQVEGFMVQTSSMGLYVIPVVEERPITDQEFLNLDPPLRESLRQKRVVLDADLKNSLKQLRTIERAAEEGTANLNQEVALFVVRSRIEELAEKHADLPAVTAYLLAVQEDMVTHLDQFLPPGPPTQGEPSQTMLWAWEHAFHKYEVNLLVDNAESKGIPVIVELNPTYNNLFGRLERETLFGSVHTDFTLIRGGDLHRANGGYLVLPVDDLVRNPLVYECLKLALRNQEIVVEELGERLGYAATKSVQPQPVPLDIKVVLVGSPMMYHLLYQGDEDFRELFKIKADFDTRMDRTEEAIRDYCGFVCGLSTKEGLRPLESSAVAKLVEQGSRLAEDQEKLSTRFSELADIVREADHHAELAGARYITEEHVQQALQGRIYRSNLVAESIQEMLRQGTLLVDTSGEVVGQVNGLAVSGRGGYTFGRPSRITASIGLGQAGLIDIEREARLGGPLHTKGMLILSGYLTQLYSQDKPLSLTARLVFEQSYGGVDGDSASSTELYALLSALSDIPIKQSLAVTGSVNQHGQVQAIGGVNEKIEGFFDLCRALGLVEGQGVLIPASNVRSLMLREDIVEAVREGRFHVYPIHTIHEGIEVLTGVSAGETGKDGRYPEGTINALVDQRLRGMAEAFRSFGTDQASEEREGNRPLEE